MRANYLTIIKTVPRARSYATQASALTRVLKRGAAIDIHPEVEEALANRRPIVALETALVTNGIPPPTNLRIARRLEDIIRTQKAVPASIGIVEGRVKIGLQDSELQRLADTEGNKGLVKVSRRDIGPIMALRKDGGTTICATLIFAHMADIKVFATGGLGGVHRGGENTMDISADLHELTRCPVGLVSAGVKSILDIGRTLEYLETLGVPVVTYGKTYDFPAFYCGQSGFTTNWKVEDPRSAAEILRVQWGLGMQNGALFAAPIPDDYVAQGAEIQAAVDQAVSESNVNGMSKKGKEATPWLLARVLELTGGRSLQSNIALLENAAVIGGQIAVEYAKLDEQVDSSSNEPFFPTRPPSLGSTPSQHGHPLSPNPLVSSTTSSQKSQPRHDSKIAADSKKPAKLVVVGASAIDITARVSQNDDGKLIQIANSTAPGTVSLTVGGVARNIAEAAHRILSSGVDADVQATLLLSPIGNDEFAPYLLKEHSRLGMRSDGFLRVKDSRTAVCNMVLDASGSLVGGIADMDINQNVSQQDIVRRVQEETPALLVVDGNLSSPTLSAILKQCNSREQHIPVFFEPTSVSKSTSILPAIIGQLIVNNDVPTQSPVTYASPNVLELSHMYREADSETNGLINHRVWWDVVNDFNLGSEWRMDLDQLARQPACPTKDKGDLSFLVKSGVAQMSINLLPFFQNLIIKCGDRGVIVVMRISGISVKSTPWTNERSNPLKRFIVARGIQGKELVVLKHFPAISMEKDEIVSVTGAGDSLVGALCACIATDPSTFHDPSKLDASIQLAQEAAVLSLHSIRAVSPLLGPNLKTEARNA